LKSAGQFKKLVAGREYDCLVATGYGRHLAAEHQLADEVITGTRAYATGANSLCPDVLMVKYEEVYLKAYQNGKEARYSLGRYFRFYNTQRPHQTLDYRTPAEVNASVLTTTSGGMLPSPVIKAGFHLIPTPILS
jgi:putative transposase